MTIPSASETISQLERPGQDIQDFGENRASADHRHAPVAARACERNCDILNGDRLIEAEANMQRRDRLLRGLIAENEHRGVAGENADNHKDDSQHREQT